MIEFSEGNIFEADVQVLCNPVNCQGIMGKGLAAEFKLAYPDMYDAYRLVCAAHLLTPGMVFPYIVPGSSSPRMIFNVATKGNWETRSDIRHVVKAITWISDLIRSQKIDSIAIPALGCGEGKLEWPRVKEALQRMMWPHKATRIILYPPKERIGSRK